MQYQVLISPHPDKAFIAMVLGWPDCVADGKTKEEAIANAQTLLTQRLAQSEIVTIEVGIPPHNQWESISEELDKVMRDDDYDDDYLPPTEIAFKRVHDLLAEAYQRFGDNLIIPYFVPDGDGGLRVEWEYQGREVRLLWPAQDTNPGNIYFEEGEVCGIEEATPNTFLKRLDWLLIR